jgi:hypothetical protein
VATSPKLAQDFVSSIQSNLQGRFNPFNGPQLTAIEAALSRRLTLIQGPPGSGKTTVAAAIGYGFVHQCRKISMSAKVLACAFSNVGADNVAEALIRLNLKVVRIGKASAVSQHLWDYTLDAAIDKDPFAQKAMRDAATATSELTAIQRARQQSGGRKRLVNGAESERTARDAATLAVKASIKVNCSVGNPFNRLGFVLFTVVDCCRLAILQPPKLFVKLMLLFPHPPELQIPAYWRRVGLPRTKKTLRTKTNDLDHPHKDYKAGVHPRLPPMPVIV